MDNKDKIVDRIRKLLAMAADVSSPEEAAIAARRASSLMAKHNIDEADVMLKEGLDDRIGEKNASDSYARVPAWYAKLIVPVAHLFDCEARYEYVYSAKHKCEERQAQFLGMDDDVLIASYVLDYLVCQIGILSRAYQRVHGCSRGEMNSYRGGVSTTIVRMLMRMRSEREDLQTSQRTGRELVEVKQALIKKKYKIEYTNRRATFTSNEHFAAGRRDGEQVSLRHGVRDHSPSRPALT